MSAMAIHRDTLGGRPYWFRLGLAQLSAGFLWQFLQCVRAYEEMHGLGEETMDEATFAELSAVLDAYEATRAPK